MNERQLELITEKYGKLIHKIGHWISGDNAIASHEDNTQDIWIAAMEAIRGYAKKENQTFEQFWGSKGFDKYLKTCLWNVKNSKGAKITKKYPITRGTVDVVGNEEVLQMTDPSTPNPEIDIYLGELPNKLTENQMEIVRMIVADPAYLKPSGKVNINALASDCERTWNDTSNLLKQIGEKIKNDL
tara:strand:- start:1092 stop:1649 length:558 start_codon:yes stop_codon:yes gene_type:complete